MSISDKYNRLDLRTRKIASHVNTDARIRDLQFAKDMLIRNHKRTIREMNDLINNLKRFLRELENDIKDSSP